MGDTGIKEKVLTEEEEGSLCSSGDGEDLGALDFENLLPPLHPLFPRLVRAVAEAKKLTLGDDIEAKEQLDNRTWGATKENWRMQNGPFQKMTARDTELTEYLEAYILETETYVAELSSLMRSADKASERTADSMIQVLRLSDCDQPEQPKQGAKPKAGAEATDETPAKAIISLKRKHADNVNKLYKDLSRKKAKDPLSEDAKAVLRTWYESNIAWPYPTAADKQMLLSTAGESTEKLKKLDDWFINVRAREWSKMLGGKVPRKKAEAWAILESKGIISAE